jgi:O-antigen ligase
VISTPSRAEGRHSFGGQLTHFFTSPYKVRDAVCVAGVLTASALLAPRASLQILGLLVGLAIAFVILRVPRIGLVALLLGALVVPGGLSTGTETEINPAIILVSVLTGMWIIDMVVRRDVRLVRCEPVVPSLVFAVVACLALIVGLQPWIRFAQTAPIAAQLGGASMYVLSMAALLLTGHRSDLRTLQSLTWIFLVLGALYIVARSTSTRIPILVHGGDQSMTHLWILAIALSQGLLNRKLAIVIRILLIGLAGLVLFDGFVLHRNWNSGWVPPLIATGVILWLSKPRLALILTVVGSVVSVMQLDTIREAVLFTEHNQYDLLTRNAAWTILWDIIRAEPFLGAGFANYYWYTPLFSILGWNVKFNSHNNYMDLLAQTGVAGFACFAWLMFSVGRLAWRLRGRVRTGFAHAYVIGAIAGLVGTVEAAYQGDWVLPFVYNVGMVGFRSSVLAWIFLGGLIAIDRLQLETNGDRSTAASESANVSTDRSRRLNMSSTSAA